MGGGDWTGTVVSGPVRRMNRGTWKIVGARVVSPLRARNLMGHSKNLPVSKRRRRRPSLDAATRSSSVLHAARFDSARLAGFHSLLLKHNPRVSSRQFVLRDPGRVSPKHTLSLFFYFFGGTSAPARLRIESRQCTLSGYTERHLVCVGYRMHLRNILSLSASHLKTM